jgi:hypothetical protein
LWYLTAVNTSEQKQALRDLKDKEKYANYNAIWLLVNNNWISRTLQSLWSASFSDEVNVQWIAQSLYDEPFTKEILTNNNIDLNLLKEEEWMINLMQQWWWLNKAIDPKQQYILRSIANNIGTLNYNKLQDLFVWWPTKEKSDFYKYMWTLDAIAMQEGRRNRPGAARLLNSILANKEFKEKKSDLERWKWNDIMPAETNILIDNLL